MASVDEKITVQYRTYKYSLRDTIGRGAFGDVYTGFVENVSLLEAKIDKRKKTSIRDY